MIVYHTRNLFMSWIILFNGEELKLHLQFLRALLSFVCRGETITLNFILSCPDSHAPATILFIFRSFVGSSFSSFVILRFRRADLRPPADGTKEN